MYKLFKGQTEKKYIYLSIPIVLFYCSMFSKNSLDLKIIISDRNVSKENDINDEKTTEITMINNSL